MKRIYSLFFSICLLLVFSIPLTASAESNEKASPVPNERVVELLKRANIEFQIVNGNIKLENTSPESIARSNKLLASEFNSIAKAAVSYPTPYVHMKLNDYTASDRFKAATKIALASATVEWAKNKGLPDPRKIGVAAAGGFGIYYFLAPINPEHLYFYIKYSYRELGPGKFDMNGNFIGDYEIKKEIRVTKNSDYSGGNLETDIRKSTVIDAWF
ncbi:hypothetical protein ABER61_26565 [Brevibacillus formosus]|uniref:Uncharacterized protein n=1 Tax=Brevibacillus formosus TaxID=54913 RepID=A0A837KGW1_9BACL|nr:hypothetical protein [Brevibacillus formosus]KLH96588.1 hypothetical protein AA984_24065 [Brevibacillus formosus]MED1960275.1 hypothetical protein [Brevibacillus formosus]PSJ93770.1 hypothetical protein C7R91_19515 [Brevibacillus formosus]GED59612.1 hypothetical protein BFO01nite_37440 [Brevibacillus formosus]